ncbi:MAG: SRPBCC domain-containing protein [Longimicrobiales bacterium]
MEQSDANITRITCHVKAPRSIVYRALLDAASVASWMVPTGMTSEVHAFDPKEGGYFRISLTYDAPTGTGKTTAHTDTYHGHFVELVEDERVVEVVEFETSDPAFQGKSTITIAFTDRDGGTEVLAVHERLPPGLSAADNEAGWKSSLAKLRELVET